MKPNIKSVKGKIWGEDPDDLLVAAELLRKALAPNVITSDLRDSEKGGYHVMITIYLREAHLTDFMTRRETS
jgi:hypothetical protein